jgi:chromosome segregation ATPase
VQDAAANNKRLDETNQQLQAQNASLSQMLQSLRANAAAHGGSTVSAAGAAAGAATPTSTAQSRGSLAPNAAAASGMEGPTPMRRRMASVNAQLERRVQELLQQKQALAAQVEQLQQQLGEQPPAAAVDASEGGLTEQQQAAWDELQQQVEHLTTCNDELMQQLEELDWSHEQLQGEKLDLQGRLSDMEQEREELLSKLQALQQQAEAVPAAAGAGSDERNADALTQQVQQLQADKGRLAQDCQQLQDRLAQALEQLQQLQDEQQRNQNNTALFERCKDLKLQVQSLQQQLQQQREVQAVRTSVDGLKSPRAGAAAAGQHDSTQEQQLLDRCEQLATDLGAAEQQLSAVQAQLDEALTSNARLAADCSSLQKAVAEAEAGRESAQQAMLSLRDRNKSLVDQLVQMQLATPATHKLAAKSAPAVATTERAAQTTASDSASSPAAAQPVEAQRKRRWTLDAGVQAELGGTDAEQATAVQQLLLLQAQAQLHEMEAQNRQAAQRHVESKQRIAQLQASLTQQEAALQAAEQQLRDAQQQHRRAGARLQRENDQLVQQLADARVQLQVLQTANSHLEARAQQQQKDLQQHAAAAKEAQLKVQELTHQQNLDKLHVAAVTAELTACRDQAQQLMAAQESDVRALTALQQKLQQAQQEGQKAAAAGLATSQAAYAAVEERLGKEVQASKAQAEQLLQDKHTLMLELQQTKVGLRGVGGVRAGQCVATCFGRISARQCMHHTLT